MEVVFGIEKNTKEFVSFSILYEFINDDIEKWTNFVNQYPDAASYSILHNFTQDKISYLSQNHHRNNENPIDEHAKTEIERLYSIPKNCLFDSALGRYLQELINDHKFENVNQLINYLNNRPSTNLGIGLEYELYSLGLDSSHIINGKSIFNKEIDSLKKEQTNLETQRLSTLAKFNELENTYNQKLQLEAPSKYWRSKFREHNKKHRNLIFALILYVFAMFIISFYSKSYFYRTLESAESFIIGKEVIKTLELDKILTYSRISLLLFGSIFLSTLFIWPIRHIVRMIISEDHLRADAKYKDSLLVTYLALYKKGTVVEKEDRQIALTSIFKQPSDGLVKDDAMPSWVPSSWFNNVKL